MKTKEELFGASVTFMAQKYILLDNFYRVKTLKLLERKPYYISELQKELGIKVYKSIHDSLKILAKSNLIKLDKTHNTPGRKVMVSLNKEEYEKIENKLILKELFHKHKIKA